MLAGVTTLIPAMGLDQNYVVRLMTDLICRIENTTARMTLNRPDALNALTHEMCLEMEERLNAWAAMMTPSPKFWLMPGAKAFCAGGDIQHLYDHGRAGDYAVWARNSGQMNIV